MILALRGEVNELQTKIPGLQHQIRGLQNQMSGGASNSSAPASPDPPTAKHLPPQSPCGGAAPLNADMSPRERLRSWYTKALGRLAPRSTWTLKLPAGGLLWDRHSRHRSVPQRFAASCGGCVVEADQPGRRALIRSTPQEGQRTG
jgi:hypothetical protein